MGTLRGVGSDCPGRGAIPCRDGRCSKTFASCRSAAHQDARSPLLSAQPSMSTQQAFGLLMHEIAKREDEFAARIVTVSPDVTVSTNLGAWVNRRNVYGREQIQDLFRAEHIPSAYNWSMSPEGQHFELGIAEMNLFAMLSAMGLAHAISGERLLPDRHAVRPIHRARPRCSQLCLLPGCALHSCGDAVGRDFGA